MRGHAIMLSGPLRHGLRCLFRVAPESMAPSVCSIRGSANWIAMARSESASELFGDDADGTGSMPKKRWPRKRGAGNAGSQEAFRFIAMAPGFLAALLPFLSGSLFCLIGPLEQDT